MNNNLLININMKIKHLFFILLMAWATGLNARGSDTAIVEKIVKNWLTAGPFNVHLPAFHDRNNLDEKSFKPVDLLKMNVKKVNKPVSGELFLLSGNTSLNWKKSKSAEDGNLTLAKTSSDYAIGWQAVYIDVKQWMEVTVKIKTLQCFELYIDDKKNTDKYSFTSPGEKPKEVSKKVKLEPGKHLLVIKSLYKNDNEPWKVETRVTKSGDSTVSFSFSLIPETFMNIDHLLHGRQLRSARISPDGQLIMLNFSEAFPPNGKTNRWFTIAEKETGKVIYTSNHSDIRQAQWAPGGHAISYTAKTAGKQNLYLINLDNMKEKILLRGLKDFTNYQWSHQGSFIIYSITEKPAKKKGSVYEVEGMPDRWPWWRSRSQLFRLNSDDLSTTQLTYGYFQSSLLDISPDDQKLLISQNFPDFSKRPYSRQVLMELTLDDLSVDTVWDKNYGGNASYSPDGKKLLVTGSPVMFGKKGTNVKTGEIPNDYDNQSYLYDLKTRSVEALTKDFNPSIQDAVWNKADGKIYFLAEDKTYRKIYSYNPEDNVFKDIGVKTDVVNNMDFSSDSPWMTYSGTSISYPATGYVVNLESNEQSMISNPEKDFFADVRFGKNENWDFQNDSGITIEGRIYYPPDFDKNKKYPLIVYYYGGTSPTERSFGGRYPKNLFAAMGYVVYVLEPSGATGYGQEFSAQHVNNWGITVADEIIKGTKLFLKDHPFIDPQRVGCIGASYGGFMTMLLTTRTDIYAAAIAHAGISSIASYWGQGYWGYLYSSAASANSFPWNNRKLYVDQSPLFHADKVTTPLLLLAGDADTNVPPGESIQMYTALKLLGKTVELVEIAGQNHHIMDYKKRILWQKTIFAWFDKWLKGQNQWWNDLYPKQDL